MRRGTKIGLKDSNKQDIRVGDLLNTKQFQFEVCFGWYDYNSFYGLFLKAWSSGHEYSIDQSIKRMKLLVSEASP